MRKGIARGCAIPCFTTDDRSLFVYGSLRKAFFDPVRYHAEAYVLDSLQIKSLDHILQGITPLRVSLG